MSEIRKNQPTFINPFTDFSFKRIFASEASKNLLKAFLNDVLAGQRHIETIEYSKNEYPGETKDDGGIIVDVVCTDEQGNTFLIEVQRAKQEFFKERSVFYASRLITEQAPNGDRKGWSYRLKEVYLIALLEDFTLNDPPTGDIAYLHHICLMNRDTGKLFYEKLGFTYIELRNFVKAADQLETRIDKWLYALKNMTTFTKKPVMAADPELDELFELAKYANLTKEEKYRYDQSMKKKWDLYGATEYAKRVGLEQGIEEGIEQGIEQGIAQGLEQGRKETQIDIARKLKANGLDANLIAETTGLSIGEIESLN